MSCEKRYQQNEGELRVTEYLQGELQHERDLAVYARHPGPLTLGGFRELEVGVGPRPAVPVASPEDQSGIAPVTLFFSIVLHDWLIERDVEEDLGPRFKEAVGLLAEAAVRAKNQPLVGASLPRTPVTRDELEVRVARYAGEALDPDGRVAVSVSHQRKAWWFEIGAADSDVEERLRLQLLFGLLGGTPEGDEPAEHRFDLDSARLVDVEVHDDGSLVEHWEAPDGGEASLIVPPGQSESLCVPLFSIRLYDWPLARQPERNLGPGFKRAASLLVEACVESRRAWRMTNDSRKVRGCETI